MPDPGEVELADLARRRRGRPCGRCRRSPTRGRRGCRGLLLGRRRAPWRACAPSRSGSLTWYGRREHRRRVLGDGQLAAVAVEDRAAGAGDDHGLGLLALGLGAQRAAAAPPGARPRGRGSARRGARRPRTGARGGGRSGSRRGDAAAVDRRPRAALRGHGAPSRARPARAPRRRRAPPASGAARPPGRSARSPPVVGDGRRRGVERRRGVVGAPSSPARSRRPRRRRRRPAGCR